MTGYSLHIGLNVIDNQAYGITAPVLAGCINDANDMQTIARNCGFQTRRLVDGQATSTAVLTAMSDLAQQATADDIVLISYSGHGGQMPDTNGDEEDGMDETWCLYDRQVVDDELSRMYAQFAPGVRVLVFSDSCHSGTVTRAVLAIATREALVRNPLGRELWPQGVRVESFRPRALPLSDSLADFHRRQDVYRSVQALAGKTRGTDICAQVLLISGCQDSQLSGDGDGNGVFTEALKAVWADGGFVGDYHSFHSAIVNRMPADQVPNYYPTGAMTAAYQAQEPFTVAPPSGGQGSGGQGSGGQSGGQSSGGQGSGGQGSGGQGSGRPTLRQGSSGPDVTFLQQRLSDLGYWLTVDGQFGPGTARTVRSFQQSQGLTADGIVGPDTWAALGEGQGNGSDPGNTDPGYSDPGNSDPGNSDPGNSDPGNTGSGWGDPGNSDPGNTGSGWGDPGNSDPGNNDPGNTDPGNSDPGNSDPGNSDPGNSDPGNSDTGTGEQPARATIRRGSKGPDVVYLQQRLNENGYSLSTDGQFGPATESAVRSFQRGNGLTADGVVGPNTWAALG
ncbi:peptidoglycan-binding protein [Aestuariimicrobium sp. T2.26MG-19.2B]|uniref:peptidoglycan-binding protein n=1 Tax=Aestuariimicrobium sp. T2.26MG-19.2B TaxID=3040679 RepID=UPI002477AE18|nr:peptidoglycan-binding protein [Aestuariimicrobium sp. T2.26MG-19.2B]CAI9401361.1 hypothetical protein AESSP_00577 [Aestuariimicrobium sp. T2.26MG-19.2B]